METKTCSNPRCIHHTVSTSVSNFYVKCSSKSGYSSRCKFCYRELTKSKRVEYNRKYRLNNHNDILIKKKIYRQENKQCIRDYENTKRSTDVNFRLRKLLRNRVRNVLNGLTKSQLTLGLIGCSIEKLKEHLQATAIKNGYKDFDIESYDSSKYHIDHIKPCSSFNLEDEEEQSKCFHYTNLQILSAEENLEKSDKV